MKFMVAVLFLIEGVLLSGSAAAPLQLTGSSLDPPDHCSLNVANVTHKETQLKMVLCHLEELVSSLQEPLTPNGGSTNTEVCSVLKLVCSYTYECVRIYLSMSFTGSVVT